MKPIKQGDHFLQPYKGKKKDLLVRAVHRSNGSNEYWWCRVAGLKGLHITYLPSCYRCPPSRVRRLLGRARL